ncbi:hypothetical protein BCV71DRAFT_283266 [Rhizopus microsporus]|uniref:Uncharacterized protein n=1 Tax=Rhizopus microsporus TaxID=58291 RepID=A0A1X0RJV4_RHIZD|nr:hypothetical protein BCV71DRAFT_283266 [Rhizopus microsporus]
MLKLQRTSCQNAMKQNINALNEVQKSYKRYNTRSHRPENENDEVYEIDGMMLAGMKRSVGSVIKTEAIRRAKAAKVYANLDKEQKNIVILGLNSICDLSNNSDSKGSQKIFIY